MLSLFKSLEHDISFSRAPRFSFLDMGACSYCLRYTNFHCIDGFYISRKLGQLQARRPSASKAHAIHGLVEFVVVGADSAKIGAHVCLGSGC